MSCFVVSDYHINALVSWARHRNVALDYSPRVAAELLATANRMAYIDRYQAADFSAFGGFHDVGASGLFPVEVLKAAGCLAYQACDWGRWETSDACQVLRAIQRAAQAELDQMHGRAVDYRNLPGYAQAAWGLIDPAELAARDWRREVAA